ncbi:hypothetical protein SAMN04489797_2918 [Winogradskyella sediminis]|uniref:Uncharacterized protein n=1 Tax=Winogradskyella sediminis TaxID=1382466 RepID=A0A1H1WP30_9FLAO|nr:hypothetical protein SAMN04489797_2918 [Winogradskyella sediminis]
MQYTKLQLAKDEMKKFMMHISPPLKFKWTYTNKGKIYTLEIQRENSNILSLESTGHWKSESGGTPSFQEFPNGSLHNC